MMQYLSRTGSKPCARAPVRPTAPDPMIESIRPVSIDAPPYPPFTRICRIKAMASGLPFAQPRLEVSRSALVHSLSLRERESYLDSLCRKGDPYDMHRIAVESLHRASPSDTHAMSQELQLSLAGRFSERFYPTMTSSSKLMGAVLCGASLAVIIGSMHFGPSTMGSIPSVLITSPILGSVLVLAGYLEKRLSSAPLTMLAVGMLESGNLSDSRARAIIFDAVSRWGRPSMLKGPLRKEMDSLREAVSD